MHYFLCVQLERFYVGILGSCTDEMRPTCVLKDKKVLDADERSFAKGVTPGMPERQARALLEKGVFKRWEEAQFADAQMEWLDRCLPYSSVIEPAEQHKGFIDLSGHPHPREIALKLQSALKWPAKMGAAQSKWIAHIASEQAPAGHLFDSAVDDARGFLGPLSVDALATVAPEHRERLVFLGCRNIHQVAELPLNVLKGQFGQEAHFIKQAALGRVIQLVDAAYPPKSLAFSMRFEGGAELTQTLDEGLHALANEAAEALISKELQGTEVRMYVEFESGERTGATRKFGKPVRCRTSALSAFRLMIPTAIEEPIAAVRFLLPNLKRVPRVQQELGGKMSASQKQRSAEAALRSVRTVYGDKAVVAGSQIELPRRVKVLNEWKDATGWA